MFKFYAAQDSERKDVTTFDINYLHSVLSFRELVRFGYQQSLIPNLVTPDDMVFVYKHLIREINDDPKSDQQHKRAGMLDYEAFKKAIVYISIIAQEKLGGGKQDNLKKKLQEDKAKMDQSRRATI